MRILIIDSYPLFREALALQVTKVVEQASIFEASTHEEAIALLELSPRFDLVISCMNKRQSDCHWLRELRRQSTELKILIFLDDNQQLNEMVQQGRIDGFLAKSAELHEIKSALKLILMGESYVSPSLLIRQKPWTAVPENQANQSPNTSLLTPRQFQVLKLIALGCSNKDIANKLNCSDGTIKLHVSAILKEFKVHNRIGAIKYATRVGIIPNT